MENTHIKSLGEVVPKEIRLQVYKETLEIIQNRLGKSGLNFDDGLCLYLPCVLWDLPEWESLAPNKENWYFWDTGKSFPELTDSIIDKITQGYNNIERIKLRIQYLKKFIKKLEN